MEFVFEAASSLRSAARGLAIATASKHGKRAKTMFQHAVRDRLLNVSPFADIKGASESNSERQFFITPDIAKKVSKACPDNCTLGKNVRGGFVVAVPITKQAPGVRQIRA